jgi:Patatin-like phospholipase
MAMTTTSDDVFNIGFALSGAISAGAYTAGVLDYFIQALDAWERARGEAGVPQHRAGIQVVTGASAGAITGALGAVALARGIRPRLFTTAEKQSWTMRSDAAVQDYRCVLPSLYQTWVVRPRMVDPAGNLDFLSSQDLKEPDDKVVSALNAALLDDIKKQALMPDASGAALTATAPYPYIGDKLHVYMTVSNLRGIPYTVSFGNSTYGMQTHGDRFHYIIDGLGSGERACNGWLTADSGRNLSVDTLPAAGQKLPPEWDDYGTCALASSAFPVGLAPRQLRATLAEYTRRSYPAARGAATIEPAFPLPFGPGGFVFLNIDGGVVNNNPFDYAQFALMGDGTSPHIHADRTERAVIMISPFPEPPDFLPDDRPAPELVAVLRALYPTLIDQARFKPAELLPAMDPDDHSRFLIAPDRNIDGVEQRYKIACGLLGGFGGFLDEKFRAFDFQLGRRNCQQFLRATFGLPAANKVVAALEGQTAFQLAGDPGKYAIIPRLGDALPEVPLPQWPRMSEADFDLLIRRIRGRFEKVVPHFVRAQTASRFFRLLGRIGLRLGKRRVLGFVRLAILTDLVRRDQIIGWQLPTRLEQRGDDVRAVLAELVSPSFSYRTPAGVATSTHLVLEFVVATLAALKADDIQKPMRVWQGQISGCQVFTLVSRKPGWFKALPIIRQIANWFEVPAIG